MIGIKVLLKCVKYLQSMVVGVGNQSKWRWAAIHNHWIVKKRLDFMACFVVNYNKQIYNNPVAQLVEHLAFNQ